MHFTELWSLADWLTESPSPSVLRNVFDCGRDWVALPSHNPPHLPPRLTTPRLQHSSCSVLSLATKFNICKSGPFSNFWYFGFLTIGLSMFYCTLLSSFLRCPFMINNPGGYYNWLNLIKWKYFFNIERLVRWILYKTHANKQSVDINLLIYFEIE